ncbi:MAG: hypothetical protein RBS85_05975 [Methanofastidiosum sp.]|jgi:hypothetical protein|nr:hypothetical protein [Methanofastidiosum sp.]
MGENKYKTRRKIWYIATIIVAIPILYFSILIKSLGTFIMIATGVSFFLREIIMRDLFEVPFRTNIKRFLITLGIVCIGGLVSFIEYLMKGG